MRYVEDEAWKSLTQVNEWIRFADAKAGAVLAASGVLGGLLVTSIPSREDFAIHVVRSILLSAAIVCVGASTLITLRILAPRLRTGEARSLIYFSHIARRYADDRNAFVENFLSLVNDGDRHAEHVAEQIWANSRVAHQKFKSVTFAIYLLGVAMVAAGSAVAVQRLGG